MHLLNNALIYLAHVLNKKQLGRARKQPLNLIASLTHIARSEFLSRAPSLECERRPDPFASERYACRVTFRGKRIGAAFAFKGRGTRKKLTPRDMGKTGNQIQRLFTSPAELFFVQYVGQIDESVVEQMHTAAVSKSYSTGKEIYYGIIDGADTMRLITAYPKSFQ